MEFIGIIQAAIAAFLGAGVTLLAIKIVTRSRQDFDKLLKVWADDNERLRVEEMASRKRVDELEEQISGLRNKIILLESSHMDLPLPMWLKDTQGVMLALNRAYEETFLLPIGLSALDYIGKHDSEIWPDDIAAEYVRNDKLVMRNRSTLRKHETLKINGTAKKVEVIKYPRYAGSVIIGIGGIAIT